MRNPKLFHGAPNVVAFVSVTNREMRNYESIGTWVTTDKEHARAFGGHVYVVETPEALKFYPAEDKDNLDLPFILPGLTKECRLLREAEKKLIRAAFVAAPIDHSFYGVKCYYDVVKSFDQTLRDLDKKDDFSRFGWLERHKAAAKYAKNCQTTLDAATELRHDKMFHSKEYAKFLWEWYVSRGYDGIAWENTNIDWGLHDRGDTYRHSQYLIFHPERYGFAKAD